MRVSRLRRTWHNGMDEPRPTPGFRSMATRTTSKTVTFHRPFRLKGVDRPLPPATHRVLTEEDLIEGLSFPAYRRVSTAIFVPAPTGGPTGEQAGAGLGRLLGVPRECAVRRDIARGLRGRVVRERVNDDSKSSNCRSPSRRRARSRRLPRRDGPARSPRSRSRYPGRRT